MHYISTRNADHAVTLGEAIARGIAPDGGLYVPQEFPHFTARHFDTDWSCRRSPRACWRRSQPAIRSPKSCRRSVTKRSISRRRWSACRTRRRRCRCWSCFTARPARSRISARASSPRAWSASARSAAQADDPGRDFRRHRRRSRRGISRQAVGRRRRAVSARAASRRGRRSSSRAGAATCGRSPCAARSTIASAS